MLIFSSFFADSNIMKFSHCPSLAKHKKNPSLSNLLYKFWFYFLTLIFILFDHLTFYLNCTHIFWMLYKCKIPLIYFQKLSIFNWILVTDKENAIEYVLKEYESIHCGTFLYFILFLNPEKIQNWLSPKSNNFFLVLVFEKFQ